VQTKTLTGGVIASVITPFAPNGEIDADRLVSEVTLLDKSPVEGLCVGGLLSGMAGALPEELRSLVMIARKATKKPLFAMVLPDVVMEAREMLRTVTDGGADVVLVAQPHYLCQPGEAGLVEMFEELKKQAKVPLLLADCFPEARVGLKTTRHLIDERLIDGVLQAADAHALVDLLCLHPRVPVYCGIEDLHYVGFMIGAYGSVSDLGSVFPGELSEVYRSFKGGKHEDARLHHERLVRLWRILSPAAERESRVRSALAAQGREVGAARSPYSFLGSDISRVIKSALQEEGLTVSRPV
jgi:4-hydroxy-tetrahydrodipicolinate synthase